MPCGSGNLLGITGGVWQRSPSIQATNSMSWYYAIGQEQKGPVTDDQLQALVRDGVITGDTLVWREGMAGWQAYRTIVPPGTLPAAGAATISTSPAPAGPEGVPQSRGRGEADFFQTDYEVLIGYAWSRGWRAFSNSAGLMIGGGLLLFLIAMVAVAIPVVSLIVTGPLTGGLYWLYLRCVRGEAAVLGDGFAGFGPQFIQLLLGNVVSGLLALLPLIPGALVLVVGGLTMAAVKRGDLQMLGGGMLLGGALLLALGGVVMIYFTVSWSMTLLLIMDKRLDFWRAMGFSRRRVGQHFFRVLLFFIVTSLVSASGIVVLGIGLLVTVPVALAMIVCLYEDMFREFDPEPHR